MQRNTKLIDEKQKLWEFALKLRMVDQGVLSPLNALICTHTSIILNNFISLAHKFPFTDDEMDEIYQ